MITNNYKKLLKSYLIACLAKNTATSGTINDNLVSVNGTNIPVLNVYTAYVCGTGGGLGNSTLMRSGKAQNGITIGTGNTPATADDRDMESLVGINNANVSGFISNKNFYIEGTKYCIDFELLLTNKTSSAITMREIGLVTATSSQYSSESANVLLDRTVLETPIVLEPTVSTPVKYTIKFDWDI